MAKKDRQKRSARQARQKKRAELEAAHAVSGHADKDQSDGKTSLSKKSDAKASKKSKGKGKDKGKKKGRIRTYFRDVRTEMHQVVWPSRPELRNYTVAVVVMLIVFGVCVWLVDTGFVTALVALAGLRG